MGERPGVVCLTFATETFTPPLGIHNLLAARFLSSCVFSDTTPGTEEAPAQVCAAVATSRLQAAQGLVS